MIEKLDGLVDDFVDGLEETIGVDGGLAVVPIGYKDTQSQLDHHGRTQYGVF